MKLSSMSLMAPKFFFWHTGGAIASGFMRKKLLDLSGSVEIGAGRCLGREEEQGQCFVHEWKGLGVGEVSPDSFLGH